MSGRIVYREEQQDKRYDLFDVYFHNNNETKIQTTVTSDADIVTDWIRYFDGRGGLTIGLDVEWRPTFNRNQLNRVATLQLCVGPRCLIFQLLYCPSIPNSLVSFLGNPEHTFVGVGIKNDLEKLDEDHELKVGGKLVDLRGLAANVYGQSNLKEAGLKELCNVVMGVEFVKPKKVTMSRWDCEWLNTDQVQYACLDAFVSYEIARLLNAAPPSTSPH